MANSRNNKSTCVVLSQKKAKQGPIAASLTLAAKSLGVDVGYFGDDLSKYENLIVFYNRPFELGNENQNVSWWMCDLRSTDEIAHVGRYDTIYLCNTKHMKAYEKLFGAKVHYLPQCGDDRDEVAAEKPLIADVLFIGNFNSIYHRNRWKIIKKLMESHDVQVISGLSYTPETKFYYRTTPFSLAISDPVEGYTSNRLYNILSAGGFCLTLYFPGIENLFENHKQLVWFKNADELSDIIEHYYNHPVEYQRVKEEGKKEYVANHSAKARLQFILGTL